MSKWINNDLFNDFQKEKIEEKETPAGGGFMRSELLWQNPDKGTVDNPKVYEGRFLQHPACKPYVKYYYHFWQSGETWKFVLCPKTHDFKAYCPFCSGVAKLYNGSKQDKQQGYLLKRKERFVGNFYVAKDPRDADRDEEKKIVGKVKIYEFPSQVEKKLKNEITNRDEGYGSQIFDPSENGRNMIIRVLSTKPDVNKKQWPDYSNSSFSRSQSALGNDEEIDALMATCTNLDEYIKSMENTKEEMVEMLKAEFLWDLVEDEAAKHGYSDVEGSTIPEQQERQQERQVENTPDPEPTPEPTPDPEPVSDNSSDDGLDDDELLAELDKL